MLDMKISDLQKLISIFNGDNNENKKSHNGEEIRIVILQRGRQGLTLS